MLIDVRSFFEERNLEERFYHFEIDDGSVEGLSTHFIIDFLIQYVDEMNKDIAISIFLLQELNASNDFILDVYFPTVAEQLIEDNIRLNKWKSIEKKVVNNESVTFTIKGKDGQLNEYEAFKDENGKYKMKEPGFEFLIYNSFN
ncbi:hypothetical protein F9U64_17835 [Gracilibacillus oryzae]|uniref:Uncharacterized protein n=1 Tax=Gracilibacillus oryzae TaxID=1672701 RepID=A0A7C8GRF8_9BACI|nr:hypothetical protein [Gracilibacillus oryzae]KAB8127373.1 hypothetical protein F9U64_17835 [Gracilibacillus oryzae]